MTENEYQKLDGLALADLLQKKEVTSSELMEHAIALANSRGVELNAIRYERYDEARQWAADWKHEGVFQGIPFLLKDSSLASKRLPMSLGSKLFTDTKFSFDATLTQRFEAAGLIPFARTTVPEFCMAPTTEALANQGPTINPWDATRSTGGSSGGAAVAVASRIVPLAHGSDGGGSIRIPAACCGVYGFKATRGRIPTGPTKGEIWGGMGTDGVLSWTVRDTAAAMDATIGRELGAPYDSTDPEQRLLSVVMEAKRKPLRIAVWTEAWDGIPVAQDCLDGVRYAAQLCRELGHEVIDAKPPALDYGQFVRSHVHVLAANIVASTNAKLAGLKRSLREDDLEPAMLDGYELGRAMTAEQYVEAINCFHHVGRVLQSDIDQYDLILSPMLCQLPVKLGYLAMQGKFIDFREKVAKYATFSAVMNASGQPAASVPIHWTSESVPVGVQIMGQFGRDDLVLRLSAELERAAPWHKRIPARFA
ncbi:amidase [Bordetella sp. 15P40C-2]|uniref:amidase n=1 Tax=Bordetella sp. 15P40C-2 TaxID=2572246 RepID=UPI00132B36A1|nr:amidase [Bordetella sp. 15P40C-2]MVW70003.1 amidase [Bordetella sp. 15P40C-2]